MNTSMGCRLCQTPFTLGSSVRCRYLANPHPTSAWSCDSAIFPVSGGQYGPVCGRIRAYQWWIQDAFNGRHRAGEHGTIDGVYCGGVAVTYGSPRQHIWTFAAGIWEITLQLTFTAPVHVRVVVQVTPHHFTLQDYFCESGCVSWLLITLKRHSLG